MTGGPYRSSNFSEKPSNRTLELARELRELKINNPGMFRLYKKSQPLDSELEEALYFVENNYWDAAEDNPETLDNYIAIPTNLSDVKLLVSKKRKHFYCDWEDAHRELHEEEHCMPTIRQFVDFIRYLRSDRVYDGTGARVSQEETNSILDSIMKPKGSCGEWLDAAFALKWNRKKSKEVPTFLYNHKVDDRLVKYTEHAQLEDYLTSSFSTNLFDNSNEYGLPISKDLNGEINYIGPIDRRYSVARFLSNPNKSYLLFDTDFTKQFNYVGVRPVKLSKV